METREKKEKVIHLEDLPEEERAECVGDAIAIFLDVLRCQQRVRGVTSFTDDQLSLIGELLTMLVY